MKTIQTQDPTTKEQDLLNLDQTCQLLNLKKSKLRSMIFKNEIPVIRLGKCLRFSRTDLSLWLNEKKFYSFHN